MLAHPAGFLADMFPPGHGLTLVAPDQPAAAWVDAALDAVATGHDQCVSHGYPHVQAHYNIDRARAEYRQAAVDLLGLSA